MTVADRIVELQTKLAARDGKPGFTKNALALRQEIARLQRTLSNG